MNLRTLAAAAALLIPATSAIPATIVMARDQVLELANEGFRLRWYCDTRNLYTGIANATCPYTTVGWKDGIPYRWGGDNTRDSFWLNVVVNGGYAGDTNSAAIVSGTYGDDCSGYVSNCWRSSRYTTSGFPGTGVTTLVTYADIAPGDIMNNAGSHVRLFEKYTGTNTTQLFECTTGVSPGRVTRRSLATDSNYEPRRMATIVAWPSLVRAVATGASTAVIDFLGHAGAGFRVYRSTDLANWTLVANETTLGVQAQSATVTGLADGTTYYFRVHGVTSGVESAASCVFPLRIKTGARKAVIVNGYDRWTRNTGSGGLPHGLLPRTAQALLAADYAFDTVDNLRIVDQTTALSTYGSAWWVLGDESTADETFGYQEQLRIQDYLASGGNLFVSGAEIVWDLVNKKNTINDEPFALNYLKCGFAGDGAAGNGYGFAGVAGTACAGMSGAFDSGSGGTFNVQYPDILVPQAGAQAVMTYTAGGTAGVCYRGTFGTGTATGSVIVLGFPLETVTTPAARNAVVNAATATFFAASGVADWPGF